MTSNDVCFENHPYISGACMHAFCLPKHNEIADLLIVINHF